MFAWDSFPFIFHHIFRTALHLVRTWNSLVLEHTSISTSMSSIANEAVGRRVLEEARRRLRGYRGCQLCQSCQSKGVSQLFTFPVFSIFLCFLCFFRTALRLETILREVHVGGLHNPLFLVLLMVRNLNPMVHHHLSFQSKIILQGRIIFNRYIFLEFF